jgi:hypothetical protein
MHLAPGVSMKKMFIAAIFLSGTLYAMESTQTTIRIGGSAARVIYVCDFESIFNCWFSFPQSYCEFSAGEVQYKSPQEIRVVGDLAKRIYETVKFCHDNDSMTRYFYAHEGIVCSGNSMRGFICILNLDSMSYQSSE